MARFVDRAPDRGDAAGDAGRRLVVDDGDGLDRARLVLVQLLSDGGRVDAVAPVARNEVDLQTKPRGHVAPQRGEVAGLEHQHRVARRQRVHERRFPGAGAGRGIDHDGTGGLKNALQPLDRLARDRGEPGPAMVDCRLRHRPQNALGHVRRTGDLEKMTSAFHANS